MGVRRVISDIWINELWVTNAVRGLTEIERDETQKGARADTYKQGMKTWRLTTDLNVELMEASVWKMQNTLFKKKNWNKANTSS